jgi:hypothetical protein
VDPRDADWQGLYSMPQSVGKKAVIPAGKLAGEDDLVDQAHRRGWRNSLKSHG